jgi:hypothetical protein
MSFYDELKRRSQLNRSLRLAGVRPRGENWFLLAALFVAGLIIWGIWASTKRAEAPAT